MTFQIRQSLDSAWYNDAMHESDAGCERGFSRPLFEWANALFVELVESAVGDRCDANGRSNVLISRDIIAVLGVTISKKKRFATLREEFKIV
jgi:hypothetical protein